METEKQGDVDMENTPVRLPDCELEVMQVVWLLEKEGERYVTAGQIMKRYPPLCRYKSTTVLTLLGRLHMKGFLLTEKRSRNKYYASRIDRDSYRRVVTREYLRRMYLDDADGLRADMQKICLEFSLQ